MATHLLAGCAFGLGRNGKQIFIWLNEKRDWKIICKQSGAGAGEETARERKPNGIIECGGAK